MCFHVLSRIHTHYQTVGKVDEDTPSDSEYESLVDVIQPGQSLTVDVEPNNGFVIRLFLACVTICVLF